MSINVSKDVSEDKEVRSNSRLERVLRSGRFGVTAELNPPDSADPHEVYDAALVLSEVCDAINATDASGAHCHMSSVAICALLTRAGYEPVMQVSCRDRNRIAIQGDLLGAAHHFATVHRQNWPSDRAQHQHQDP